MRRTSAGAGVAAYFMLAACAADVNERRGSGLITDGTGGAANAVDARIEEAGGGAERVGPAQDVVRFTLDPALLGPGEEKYLCQNFRNPFGGVDAMARTFESHLDSGGHHLLLSYYDVIQESAPIEPCAAFEFGPTVFGGQQRQGRLEFPDGVAIRIPGSAGVRIQVHYVNASDEAVSVGSSVDIQTTDPSTVIAEAGNLFVTPERIEVPPHSESVAERHCRLPFDVNVVAALSHMHRVGVGFQATIDEVPLFSEQAGGEASMVQFSPPVFGAAGSDISVACSYRNPRSVTIFGGPSFETEEMCILSAYFYPLPPETPVTVGICAFDGTNAG